MGLLGLLWWLWLWLLLSLLLWLWWLLWWLLLLQFLGVYWWVGARLRSPLPAPHPLFANDLRRGQQPRRKIADGSYHTHQTCGRRVDMPHVVSVRPVMPHGFATPAPCPQHG